MMPPFRLSNDQFILVMEAANRLSFEWRSRFLDSVVDALLDHEDIEDDDVQRAIRQTLDRIGAAS
jgi:hypothetical protein